jgi:cell wall assembly regulator SMI1
MTRFARKCSVTGKGINEGYCVNDGEFYFSQESQLVKFLRDRDSEDMSHLSDDFILKEAYDLEEYYWTEWEDGDDYQYQLVDGKLEEIEE